MLGRRLVVEIESRMRLSGTNAKLFTRHVIETALQS
jgi:hypothetical protein